MNHDSDTAAELCHRVRDGIEMKNLYFFFFFFLFGWRN